MGLRAPRALAVAAAMGCLLLAGCARTIQWDLTGPESSRGTIEVHQKSPIFEIDSVDGAKEYPTDDGESLPFRDDFERLRIEVMPGEHTLVLICRYRTYYRNRETSFGRFVSRRYTDHHVTRTVPIQPGTRVQITYGNTCPAEPPCQGDDCPD